MAFRARRDGAGIVRIGPRQWPGPSPVPMSGASPPTAAQWIRSSTRFALIEAAKVLGWACGGSWLAILRGNRSEPLACFRKDA